MTLDLATVGADDFEPHLGTTFTVHAGDDALPVTLADVRRGPAGPTRAQFTLTLTLTRTGGPNPPVPQGILHLDHDSLGGFDLFLVPIGPGADGRHRYEAVFA